ncbi:hypothetical protein BD410DRAFT_783692 [Rickenella mellea]|uniref:Uncharacterized protein n=1 Tax=Rickenella mellea TaxID=50990 RepID=A0A4Y7QGY4_9AGAM|nr:hypothetical protein BD410DRAFT_783692 [Rickenella mellea]
MSIPNLDLLPGDSTTNVNPATQVYSETESFGFGATNITCHYQSITSVPFYRTWSFEVLCKSIMVCCCDLALNFASRSCRNFGYKTMS